MTEKQLRSVAGWLDRKDEEIAELKETNDVLVKALDLKNATINRMDEQVCKLSDEIKRLESEK